MCRVVVRSVLNIIKSSGSKFIVYPNSIIRTERIVVRVQPHAVRVWLPTGEVVSFDPFHELDMQHAERMIKDNL